MICPECKSELTPGDVFCGNCGAPVAPQQPAGPVPPQRRPVAAPQQPIAPGSGATAPAAPPYGGAPVVPKFPQATIANPLQTQKKRRLIIIISAVVAVLLITGGLTAYFLITDKGKDKPVVVDKPAPTPQPATPEVPQLTEEQRIQQMYGNNPDFVILSDDQKAAIQAWQAKYSQDKNTDFTNQDYVFSYDDPAATWYVQQQLGIDPVGNPSPLAISNDDNRNNDAIFEDAFGMSAYAALCSKWPITTNAQAAKAFNAMIVPQNKAANISNQYSWRPAAYSNDGVVQAAWDHAGLWRDGRFDSSYLQTQGSDGDSSQRIQPNQILAFDPVTSFASFELQDNSSWYNSDTPKSALVSGRITFTITTWATVEPGVLGKNVQTYDYLSNDYSQNLFSGINYGTKEYLQFDASSDWSLNDYYWQTSVEQAQ